MPEHHAYVDGAGVTAANPDGELVIRSPGDLDDLVGTTPFRVSLANDAVSAARRAFPAWDALGLPARVERMQAFRAALAASENELAQLISREVGKPLREGRAEAKALVNKIDLTITEGMPFITAWERDGGKLATRYRPHGVMAVLGPFNFPLHLANGHVVPALLAGNTVVFKPSDLAPGCALLYASLAARAGFPPGVFNVVPGDGRVGAALVDDIRVDGVLFTGSFEVGRKIQERSAAIRPDRVVALEMGGKNAAIVLDDAPVDKALLDVLLSAFSTSGQRCTCASRLIVTRGIAGSFVERLGALADGLVVGHPLDEGAFMGPLASAAALEKFERAQRAADTEGSHAVRPVRTINTVAHAGKQVRGHYAAPRLRRVTRPDAHSVYQREEIFGPDLAVYVADDADHALALANDSAFGLAAGLWTRDAAVFEKAASTLDVGCLSWNAPTVGSSSRLPFGGTRRSGNHRAAGILSTLYCAWPMALTRGDVTVATPSIPPGVPWPAA